MVPSPYPEHGTAPCPDLRARLFALASGSFLGESGRHLPTHPGLASEVTRNRMSETTCSEHCRARTGEDDSLPGVSNFQVSPMTLRWKVGVEQPPFRASLPRVDRAPPLPRLIGRRNVRNSRECHPSQCHARARAARDACRLRSLPQRALWWLP